MEIEAKIEELRNENGKGELTGYEGDKRVKAYLEENRKWTRAEGYKAPITFLEMQEKGRAKEDGTVIILACTDPRCTPEEYLGMSSKTGNKATIIRTAGGRATPALSTLLNLSVVGNHGKKGTIMVIGHTDCGLQSVDEEEIHRILVESLTENGLDEAEQNEARDMLGKMRFGSFVSPDESVTSDVEMLKKSPFFRSMRIEGFVLDTETGVVWEVGDWRRECRTDELVRVDERRGRLFDG